jgi:hypothetical protein
MTSNRDVAKILGVIGALIGIIELLLRVTNNGQIFGHIVNFGDLGIQIEATLTWIIALVICIIALLVSLGPSGVLMIIMGILMILFASTLGGILVILGGIVDVID